MNNTELNKILFQPQEEETIDLTEILYKYLVHWKWFVLSFIVALLAGFFYLKTQVPVYSIQSSVLIKDDKKGLGQDDMLKQLNIFSGTKVVDNEIDILKSYTLMEQVVTGLNLQVQYFREENFKNIELYGETSPIEIKVIKPAFIEDAEPLEIRLKDAETIFLNDTEVALNKEITSPYGTLLISLTGSAPDTKALFVSINDVSVVTENYMELLTVEASSKMSTVLNMSIESAVPQKGVDILNKLVDAYNQAGLEDKNKVAANTLTFIENRLKLVAEDLTEVEKNVENYKSSEGITDISTESKLFLESVQQNDLQLNQIRIQESVLNSVYAYVLRKNNTSSGTVPATLGISDPTLLSLINQLVELEAKREQTIKLVKEDNPLMLAIDEQIRKVKVNLSENIQTLQKNLAVTRQQLENQNARIESTIKTIPGKERKLVDITRQQAIKNNLYTFLLQKREETALSYASAVSDSRIIDRARSRNKPVSPGKVKIFLLFALAGLAVPFGIIFIKDLLNNKISSRQEIEKATKAPILAEISYAEHEEALVISNLGQTVMAEQIRALRTNLAFASPGQTLQTLLFTSGMSGEGKTFISLNLGASLAMVDKKTIILEMDMRKPKLHASLNMANGLGISNYLTGQATLDEIIQPVLGQENYYIITCGTIPPNPAELLTKGHLDELFKSLKATFDYIIVDAPPVGVVTDAQIIEQHADATIYILRHNYTFKTHLPLVDTLHKENKFKNLNLVFNSVNEKAGYNYGYGYGYTENDKKSKKKRASARA